MNLSTLSSCEPCISQGCTFLVFFNTTRVCVESLSTFKGSVEASKRSVGPTWANLHVETATSAAVEESSASAGLIAGGRFCKFII